MKVTLNEKGMNGMQHRIPLQINIPTKTFVLGEYAVLLGQPALMLAHEPFFSVTVNRIHSDAPVHSSFHPESPAGRWVTEHRDAFQGLCLDLSDPLGGIGGLGRSSAEFIGVWWALHQLNDLSESIELKQLYMDYLNCSKTSGQFQPSGVDVLTQCVGGGLLSAQVKSSPSFKNIQVHPLEWPFDSMKIMLMHTQTHCSTAEHVATLTKIPQELSDSTHQGIQAIKDKSQSKFLSAIESFVHAQALASLITPDALNWIDQISALEGVYGVKGCGALGSDVMILFYNPQFEFKLMQASLSLGLLPIGIDSKQTSGAFVQPLHRGTRRV